MANWRRMAAFAGVFVLAAGTGVADAASAPHGAARNPAPPRAEIKITRLLGEQRVPHMMDLEGTTVGGLSGFDRDPATGEWYFISDDRWRYDPARFYTGRMTFNTRTGAFTGVRLTGVTTFKRADGTPYPGYGKPESADPETIRFDRWGHRLLWGHEGDRPDQANPAIPVSDLFLRWSDRKGRHLGELPLPRNLAMTDGERGPRRNFGFEGLTFTPKGVAAIVEGPLHEDGEPPTVERGAPARITVWNRDGEVTGQYAYQLDRLAAAPVPAGGHTDTGVSELLAVDGDRFLALERSWIEGVGYRAKVYEVDLRGATDVLSRAALASGRPYRPVAKRLVLDLGTAGTSVQNYEGLAWGPRLRGGECTLVVGSDDNFDAAEETKFVAFGVRGC